jgi:hypothetical protein
MEVPIQLRVHEQQQIQHSMPWCALLIQMQQLLKLSTQELEPIISPSQNTNFQHSEEKWIKQNSKSL